jgi:CHAT domain-containing protein/tetratricopeptide (TPR) repeat protein
MVSTPRWLRAGVPFVALIVTAVVLAVWFDKRTAPRPARPAQSDATSEESGPIRALLAAGRFDAADRAATDFLNGTDREYGPDSRESAKALDLQVEARVRNGRSGAQDTLDAAMRASALEERVLAADDPQRAVSIANLAVVRRERGELVAALPLHQRALEIRKQALGPDHPLVADSLDDLALTQTLLQQFADAQRALGDATRVRESRPNDPLPLARTLYVDAQLRRYDGRYAQSMALLNRALEIRQRLQGADHPDVGEALQLKGELEFLQGDVAAAREDWTRTLAIVESRLRPEHPDIALTLRWLALAAKAFGDLSTARSLLERALPIGRASLAPCHQERPGLLNDFASLLMYEGDYQQARTLYDTALTTRTQCLGPNDQRTATVVHNQALLAAEIGDFALAEQLHRRAIDMWSAGLGPNHPYVARGLDALAQVVDASGSPAKALSLYEQALAARRRSLGDNHPEVAWTLTNMAEIIGRSANVNGAVAPLNEAIAIYRKSGVGDEPDHLAKALALRGALEARRGNFQTARASFREALELREQIFGLSHPLVAEARAEIAAVDFADGSRNVVADALEAERMGRDHLRSTIRYLPERQAMAYAEKRPRGLDVALSAVATAQSAELSAVFGGVIGSRGVILDELAERTRTSQGAGAELALVSSRADAARRRYANLMLRSLRGEEPVPPSVLDEARTQKEAAERAQAEASAPVRPELSRGVAGVDDIRAALPAGSALVSYIRYDRTEIVTAGGRRTTRLRPSYLAFVVRADATPIAVVALGSAETIDKAVAAWQAQADGSSLAAGTPASQAERAYRVAGASLRDLIWSPLNRHLAGAVRVFIVPDGALNLVSFAALPVGASRYLVEDSPSLHYLSTERDLVASTSAPVGHGLLAIGGPAFDEDAPITQAATRGSPCASGGVLHFDDLPGSRNEATNITKLWPSTGSPTDAATLLVGRAATKTATATAAVGRRVIHLATHGYFLDSRCGSAVAGTRSVGGIVGNIGGPVLPQIDNPLVLAGLAFAGANVRRGDGALADNGILTAEEVVGLNLQGVEWAVLSACDTGTGQIKAGEGVFGLRRAFQIAGARTVIMSLWAIGDESTASWMRDLYDARFNGRLSTADSVRQANLRALDGRRARQQSTHPFYWAGFVAAGAWR